MGGKRGRRTVAEILDRGGWVRTDITPNTVGLRTVASLVDADPAVRQLSYRDRYRIALIILMDAMRYGRGVVPPGRDFRRDAEHVLGGDRVQYVDDQWAISQALMRLAAVVEQDSDNEQYHRWLAEIGELYAQAGPQEQARMLDLLDEARDDTLRRAADDLEGRDVSGVDEPPGSS
jgi:hypothetical protein